VDSVVVRLRTERIHDEHFKRMQFSGNCFILILFFYVSLLDNNPQAIKRRTANFRFRIEYVSEIVFRTQLFVVG